MPYSIVYTAALCARRRGSACRDLLKTPLYAPTYRVGPNQKRQSTVDFIVFVSQEWLLVTALVVLINIYVWRDRIKSGRPVSPHEVTRLVNAGTAVLVDLRDGAEFKAGHIVGALNVPYAKLNKESTEVASYKDKTIILVDKLGQHAGVVGRFLGKEGFDVRRLGGGIAEWQAQNLPLVKGK